MDTNELQQRVNDIFQSTFGRTPLTLRLKDILGEAIELQRATDVGHLREEAGDLMASLIQLYNESGWEIPEILNETFEKIERRKKQYQSMGRKINVALYGGSFNMIHTGHIQTAQLVLDVTEIDEVWFLPCYRSLHGKDLAEGLHRLKMCEIAARHNARFKVSDFEIVNELNGSSLNLVTKLLNKFSDDQYRFHLVIGQDNANTLDTWENFTELEKLIPFITVPRKGIEPDFSKGGWFAKHPHIWLVGEGKPNDFSSTEARIAYYEQWAEDSEQAKQLIQGRLDLMVDIAVQRYIRDNGLEEYYINQGKADLEKRK